MRSLTKREFRHVLLTFNIDMSDADFETFFATLDRDGSGVVDYGEFVRAYGGAPESGLQTTFSTDTRGQRARANADAARAAARAHTQAAVRWDVRAVTEALGERLRAQTSKVTRAFLDADTDRSGAIDHDEFRAMLRKVSTSPSPSRPLPMCAAL